MRFFIKKTVHLLIFILSVLFAQDAVSQIEGYELFWQDEFDGTQLDTTKWRHRGLGSRRGGTVVEDAVSLDGQGHLLITTTILDSTNYFVGMIGTGETFNTTYGYFECRAKFGKKMPWDSFWMQAPGAYTYPPSINGAEIDIFEYYGDTVTVGINTYIEIPHNTFWGSADGDGLDHNGYHSMVKAGPEYHTVAVEWTPDAYKFYVDDVLKFTSEIGISGADEYIILSEEPRSWASVLDEMQKRGLEFPVLDTFTVDYVRVYKKSASALDENDVNIPHNFSLEQNYPNPFNPNTSIAYTITKDDFVLLKVYDTTGREVAVLVNGQKNAGVHHITFDGTGLPSGIYYYQMIVGGNYKETKKMLLVQ